MQIDEIPLNGMIDNDGSIRCFYEIQTQEALQRFYDDVIEPQLLHELDDYLNSDYRNWIEDKIAPLPPFLRQRMGNCKFADTTMDEINEYLEDVGNSPISELPLPINNKTLMIGDTIH